jgi:restriction system protein
MSSMRVHELAKELGLSSRELLERIQNGGLDVRPSPLAPVTSEQVDRIRRLVQGVSTETVPDPVLLLGAIVRPIDRISDGSLIECLAPAWEALIRHLHRDPDLAFKLDPRKWEEIIAASYDRAGFDEVILTPRSGDFGRDVIAVKKGMYSVRIIDQVKAYAPGHLVPANDVRALLGVLSGEQNTSKGIVTTTSDFAPRIHEDPFIKPFMPYRLELINGKNLLERLKELAKLK